MSKRSTYYQLVTYLPKEIQPRALQLLQDILFKDEQQILPVTTAASVSTVVGVIPVLDGNSKILGYTPVYQSHG